MAYLLLYRHAHLILDDLPTHPHAKDAQFKPQWVDARKAVRRSLGKMEVLKPRINKKYEKHQERLKSRVSGEAGDRARSLDQIGHTSRGLSIGNNGQEIGFDTDEHKDLAVRLANREVRRRMRVGQEVEEDTASLMVATRRQLDQTFHTPQLAAPHRASLGSTYNYPMVGGRTSIQSYNQNPSTPLLNPGVAPPPPPPHSRLEQPVSGTPDRSINSPPRPNKLPAASTNLSSRSSTPEPTHQFASTSHTEGGTPLRTIFLPSPLRHSFLRYATANTSRNLETCGILCGTLIRNAFFITKLVIPAQTSTSDTCEMVDEAALYTYIDGQPEELMVLGWIHTHPTQTCFMSSRDLHTHVWYQVQLPESVAIVCSPSKSPE